MTEDEENNNDQQFGNEQNEKKMNEDVGKKNMSVAQILTKQQ